MVLLSSIQFIDTALYGSGSFALSYANHEQKWIIREHLSTLLQEFPSLNLSMDTFNHNDGTTVNLLYADGNLHISQSTPPIPLTIWLHENYPFKAPMVYISPNSIYSIRRDHPFVDVSGAVTSTYLQSWSCRGPGLISNFFQRWCNLSEFVHNLVKLFSHNHPFCYATTSSSSQPYIPSKLEAIDRLTCRLHYDIMDLMAETEEEIENLSTVQSEMVNRVGIATRIIIGLEHERTNLKEVVRELTYEADDLINWLGVKNYKRRNSGADMVGDGIEDVFDAVDENSKVILEFKGADMALEDLIYALDQAIEQGVVTFDLYIRQVRILAREQFYCRARLVKLKGPKLLEWPN